MYDFKYTKYSIDVPPAILGSQTLRVIIGEYTLSTGSPIIPDPVYIEDSVTTLTLPTLMRAPITMPEVSYVIGGLVDGMYIAPTVQTNEPLTFDLTIKPCAMKTVGTHTLSVNASASIFNTIDPSFYEINVVCRDKGTYSTNDTPPD